MIVFVILAVVCALWVVDAWFIMLIGGAIHSEVLPAVIPFNFNTALGLALFLLFVQIFTMVTKDD